MQSESAIENRAPVRGRGRKRGSGSAEGPVFVDNSGRRARLVRRIATLICVLSLGYMVVLGLAFMGWGTSLSNSITPFGGQAGSVPGGNQPQGGRNGVAPTGTPPSGLTRTRPSGAPRGVAPSPSVTTATDSSISAN